jgi:hydrogenase/urease accessory protein HupE
MARSTARRAALIALLAALAPGAAIAHQTPYSYVDLHMRAGTADGRVAAHIVDLAHETGMASPESLLDSSFVARHVPLLTHALTARLDIRADGRRLTPQWDEFAITRDRKLVAFRFHAMLPGVAGRIDVMGPMFPYDPAHETYVNVFQGDSVRSQDVLDRAHVASVTYMTGTRGVLAVVRTFVAAGIHHIFIGPDHILFIIGLLLLGGSIGRLLKIVTAFTVAHSITLALAALQLVNPPSRIIEPAIALSIVVVGAENLLGGGRRDFRAAIAFAFGFVHGFGFASVLREFGLPAQALGAALFSFNLGVEAGQLCIVLAVTPLLALVRARRPEWMGRVVSAGSAAVIAAGAYWFVQRVFFA